MTRKSGNYWKTDECGRCGEPHRGFSGKLDRNDIEYVICPCNKRMNVSGGGNEGNSFAFPSEWVKEEIRSKPFTNSERAVFIDQMRRKVVRYD